MSLQNNYIVCGPSEENFIPSISLGKLIYNLLVARDRDSIINIDADTKSVLTCGEFLRLSIEFSQLYKTIGLRQGDVIAIICPNSIYYFVLVVAAFYLGIVVNPINPDYSLGEMARSLNISKPKLIFCRDTVLNTVISTIQELNLDIPLLTIKSTSDSKDFESLLSNQKIDVSSFEPVDFDCTQQAAFIMFSSGSTGFPKGVMLTHDNIRTPLNILGNPRYGDANPVDIGIIVMPFCHIYGSLLQMLGLITSTMMIIFNKFKPDLYLEHIEKQRVSKLYLVPSLFLFLLKSPLVNRYNLSSIKEIVVGSAPLNVELVRKMKEKISHICIRQCYGLTETAGPCVYAVDGNKEESVGTVGPNIVAKVTSSTNSRMGPGHVGEICLKGPAVMKGYIPEQNFVDEDGFLHTGDLGFYDNDGYFYIVDRIKELIKYKGFQVAPAELEALILMHSSVRDCGVIGIPDELAGQVPFAFVVTENGTCVKEQDIINYVAERISFQKHLRGGVTFVDEIPRNAAGKIIRFALTQMFQSVACAK